MTTRILPMVAALVFVAALLAALGTGSGPVSAAVRPDTLMYPGPCDNSDLLSLGASPSSVLFRDKVAVRRILLGRIAACRAALDLYTKSLPGSPSVIVIYPAKLPTPQPPATPPPDCVTPSKPQERILNDDVNYRYAVLTECVAFLKSVAAAVPSVSPSPSPLGFRLLPQPTSDPLGHTPPPLSPSVLRQVVYVLALATDAPTSAQISLKLASRLDPLLTHDGTALEPYTGRSAAYRAIAEPTWTVAQYQQQCQSDPSTAGALIALPPGTQSGAANGLIWSWSWTVVDIQVLVADCEPADRYFQSRTSYITGTTNLDSAKGGRGGVPLASLLAIITGVTALRPVHQTGTMDTYTAAPSLASPNPGSTQLTSIVKSDSTTTNNNANSLIVASSALSTISSTSIGQSAATDAQISAAVTHVIPQIISDLQAPCVGQQPRQLVVPAHPVNVTVPSPVPLPMQCYWLK